MKKISFMLLISLICISVLSIKSYATNQQDLLDNSNYNNNSKTILMNENTKCYCTECNNKTYIIPDEGKKLKFVYDKLTYEFEISKFDEKKSKLGKKAYKKKVSAIETIFGKDGKPISKETINVTFHYDNKSAWINNINRDISQETQVYNKQFLTSANNEIFNSPSQCIVSAIEVLYKKKIPSFHWKYYNNSHIDFICSPGGDIYYNIKDYDI